MRRILVGFLVTATLAFSQSGIGTPHAGILRDAGGRLRAVWGIRGNFFLGPSWMEGAFAASYSGSFAIIKNDKGVFVFDRGMGLVASQPSQGSGALFAFAPDGAPFAAYVPETGEMYRWLGTSFEALAWPRSKLKGAPLAIAAADSDAIVIVVERDDTVWMVKHALDTGRVLFESMLPGVSSPVYLSPDGTLVYARRESSELVVLWCGRIEQRLPYSGAVSAFEQIGRQWIRVIRDAESIGLALRLEQGQAALYQLPGGVE